MKVNRFPYFWRINPGGLEDVTRILKDAQIKHQNPVRWRIPPISASFG